MSAERSPDVRRSPPKNIFGGRPADPRGTGRSPRVSARIRANPRRKFFRRASSRRHDLFWAIGSAEDLPPRFRPNPRGNARTPLGSAQIRRTSAKNIFRRTPPNVRRTFGGHRRTPRGYGRIRAESAANWRKSSLKKCPPTTTYLTPLLLAEKLPRRTTVRRGNISRVRVRVRVGVRV